MPFESFPVPLTWVDRLASRRDRALDSFGLAFYGLAASGVYSEKAFRHFLELERVRARRSSRSLLLLLAQFQHSELPMSSRLSRPLFLALSRSVREVDFIGWYHERRVVGAVLTQGGFPLSTNMSAPVAERTAAVLRNSVPSHLAADLQVKIVELGSTLNS